jgi:hypothetical protein
MTLKNHGKGKGKWQYDHKIAVMLFDVKSESGLMKAFNYKNMQPLWHEDHIIKTRKDNELIKLKKKST